MSSESPESLKLSGDFHFELTQMRYIFEKTTDLINESIFARNVFGSHWP